MFDADAKLSLFDHKRYMHLQIIVSTSTLFPVFTLVFHLRIDPQTPNYSSMHAMPAAAKPPFTSSAPRFIQKPDPRSGLCTAVMIMCLAVVMFSDSDSESQCLH